MEVDNMNTNDKKPVVSIQDFLLNNPQTLSEVKDSLTYGIYDWSDENEVASLLNNPDQ